jgi:Zn-dependent protease
MDISDTIRQLVVSVLPILVAITFHEVSHGFVANRLGDPTAKLMGRLTLNPVAHIDLVGTIILPVILLISGAPVFGYAKPVPINPANFKDPRRDMAISAVAGPITNVILAILSLLILKFFIIPLTMLLPKIIGNAVLEPLTLMFIASIQINVFLAAFNLIPIPPLDGGRVLVGLLPHKQAVSYSRIEPFGFIIVIILIATGIAGIFVIPLANFFLALLKLF